MSSSEKVALIGCGASGLSVLVAFNHAQENGDFTPEVVCFEKQDQPGGLWNYSWHTGTDKYGEQCHGSMYRYLWSNGPKEVLEFADYTFADHFKMPIGSYPPRPVMRDYIVGRAKKNNVDRFVRYSTIVRRIEPDGKQFVVTSENLKNREEKKEVFDYVIVASGHFSVPYLPIPGYPGIDDFNGRVLHSHDFRDAVTYQGMKMLLIGNSYSAEDIALQCNKYGVEYIRISYRTAPTGYNWPDGIKEIPQLEKFEDGQFHFIDGSKDTFDVLMFCTGYQHHFPYLSEDLRIKTKNLIFIDGLYKGVIHNQNTRLMYVGMHDQWYTFTMFDAQAFYARDHILGKFKIEEDKEKREEDIKEWGKKYFEGCKTGHDDINYQRDYIADLFKYIQPFEDLEKHNKRAELLHDWKHRRNDPNYCIATYRDQSYTSVLTNDIAPLPKTPWIKNMDDSLEGYLRDANAVAPS